MEKLVNDVISKKELKNLDKEFVKRRLKTFFDKNRKLKRKLEENDYNKKSKEYKEAIKSLRKELREIYGVFILKGYDKKEEQLKKLRVEKNKTRTIKKILELHKSTKERLHFYEEIYKKIFSITKKPKKVLDLGCGLNPVSYHFLNCKPEYLASDINKKDLKFIEKYFKIMRIKGKTFALDLINDYKKLKKYNIDVCFLFKTLDSLETIKQNISKEIIKNISAKYIVVSFSKTSLGGRKEIKKNKRNWFIKELTKQGLKYQTFELVNELFLVVKK